ncbi:hypothetical protein [uncultured Dysgonomonas sp.]|nr:hypothetical protein [uncultured Dysgonomonas sp.]
MKKSNFTTMLVSKAVFSFGKVSPKDNVKSTQHPTTTTTSNSTHIFSCFE